jgi:dTDP-4-dehydrorhamnose 3,5-epimerase
MASVQSLTIQGAWVFKSPLFSDNRGFFRESFDQSLVREKFGRDFVVALAGYSSSKKGVLRGIHFSKSSGGQTKWISCTNGKVIDVIVDMRPNSPTFQHWEAVELNAHDGKSILISAGLGHAFVALEDNTNMAYLFDTPYEPEKELVINPLDTEIGITWPKIPLNISHRDSSAPTLKEFLNTQENLIS